MWTEAHSLLRRQDIHRKDKNQLRDGQAAGVTGKGYRKASCRRP